MKDKIKELLLNLEEFDEEQVIGCIALIKSELTDEKMKLVYEYINNQENDVTRNGVFTYIMNLSNIDMTPLEIED